MDSPQKIEYGTFRSYLLGFLLSILLTLAAYFLAPTLSGLSLDLSIGALALAQALLQLFLFLNLATEPKPRWNILVFLFMILVVIILVAGSIWIMNNLNYNLMIP